jgi:UPF0755 protein
MSPKINPRTTLFLLLSALLLLPALAAAYIAYAIHAPAFALTKPVAIYVDETRDYPRLLAQLQSEAHLKNPRLFHRLAQRMNYPQHLKTGKYEIRPGLSCLAALRMLRNGAQTPVKLTFNNIRLKSELVERIAQQMMFSPDDLLRLLNDSAVAATFGLDTATVLTLFIPNTYEIYWNTPPVRFLERMHREHDRFWTNERRAKAQKIGLTPAKVAILASIVEEETAAREEYATVAGLYLNRLKKGMLLQADPTVKFAVGDVTLKRILYAHLRVDSPYNTYLHPGLPPGPIRIPAIPALEAVLNAREHAYLYMCAKEDLSGTHRFAATSAEHHRNAQRYRQALDRLRIR